MTDAAAETLIDLTNCDREPIHVPGAILPHGALLVVDPTTMLVEQVAGDTAGLLGLDSATLLNRPLDLVLSAAQVAHLNDIMSASTLTRPRHILHPILSLLPDRPIDASIHLSRGLLLIEVEDADLDDRHVTDPLASVQEMLDGLNESATLQDFCQTAAERVRAVAGYDRVMVYRFLHDDSGWVVAEARRADLPSLLDLHYPAADIPKQARALYLAAPIRLIAQVDYDPAPLVPELNPRTGEKLDMSFATLRDVSPIHREYLRNMGVDASMSISIVREGRLWGLIACHHGAPRRLPRHLRAIFELFGSFLSLQLEARLRAEQFESRLRSRKLLNEMMQALAAEDDYAAGLVREAERLHRYITASGLSVRVGQSSGGIAIRVESGITVVGDTPDDAQISALIDWLSVHMQDFEGIFTTDRLGEIYPPAREFAAVGAGLIALSVSREPRDFILWFRPEVIETVSWGGDPHKSVEIGPHGDRLTPRKSFEVWKETVRGRSAPWADSDSDAAFDLRVSLLEIVLRRIDAAARERLRAWEQERLLMNELDHRVKNTLANIQALVAQTGRSATCLAEFTEGLDRRIRAMSRAHSLLTQTRWDGISIASLVTEELEPYFREGADIRSGGPAVVLTSKAALALSLALHELATNAAKYGALSVGEARLAVTWALDEAGLALRWEESGGPTVAPPQRKGFGSTLIERALALETGGSSRIDFAPGGVVCEIELPAAAILRVDTGDAPAPSTNDPAPPAPAAPATTAAQRILVVEDSALIVMLIEQVLGDLGWTLVGPAARVSEALRLAEEGDIDAALLDVNLHGEMSWEVAARLRSRGIPFVFTTGYDGGSVLPPPFAGQAVLNKPFNVDDLEKTLRGLVAAG